MDRYKIKFKKLYFRGKEAGFAPNNIYLKFRPEEKTDMRELRQKRDTPGWQEPVDPSIDSLTCQVSEMSQQLKYSTRGRKRDNDETTMDMSDDDSKISSLGASRKYAVATSPVTFVDVNAVILIDICRWPHPVMTIHGCVVRPKR